MTENGGTYCGQPECDIYYCHDVPDDQGGLTMPTDRSETRHLSTDEYREGPLGFGPLGHTWRDKPHRLIYDLCDEVDALRETVKSLVVAAGRMLDNWAEGDDAVKLHLWTQLHKAADDADERHGIYPL